MNQERNSLRKCIRRIYKDPVKTEAASNAETLYDYKFLVGAPPMIEIRHESYLDSCKSSFRLTETSSSRKYNLKATAIVSYELCDSAQLHF